MKMEFDMTKMVEEIAMQAKENQEEFIIETIRPYCENILQIKINKEELKQILLNGIRKQQLCEDAISREEAINELKLAYFNKDLQSAKDDPCIVDAMTDWAIRTIKNLPSVTPSHEDLKEAYINGYDYGVKDWFKVKTDKPDIKAEIIKRIEQVRDMDKNAGEYPYNRCIEIIKEVMG